MEIVVLRPHKMDAEEIWERYTDLIGLLTIDAKAHFAVVDEEDEEMCAKSLAAADYVLPDAGCAGDFVRLAMMAGRLSGVVACGDDGAARRFADAVLCAGRDCRVVSGDREQILKQIKAED